MSLSFSGVWRSLARQSQVLRFRPPISKDNLDSQSPNLPFPSQQYELTNAPEYVAKESRDRGLPIIISTTSSDIYDPHESREFGNPAKRRKINEIHGVSNETLSPFISPVSPKPFGAVNSRQYSTIPRQAAPSVKKEVPMKSEEKSAPGAVHLATAQALRLGLTNSGATNWRDQKKEFLDPLPKSHSNTNMSSSAKQLITDDEDCTLSEHFSHMTVSDDEGGPSESSAIFSKQFFGGGFADGYQDLDSGQQQQKPGLLFPPPPQQHENEGGFFHNGGVIEPEEQPSPCFRQQPFGLLPTNKREGYQDFNFRAPSSPSPRHQQRRGSLANRSFSSPSPDFFPPLSPSLPSVRTPRYLSPSRNSRRSSRTAEDILSRYRTSSPSSVKRDWNQEHRIILSNPNKPERSKALHQLSRDFRAEAKRVAKILINESHMPVEMKSIKPIEGCGVAGGDKYLWNNIFFKVANDSQDLYGGHQNAHKVTGHEFKSIVSFAFATYHRRLHCGHEDDIASAHFAMTSMIDYRGHRILATSFLPVSSRTLIYGSNDGGYTVQTANTSSFSVVEGEKFEEMMKDCAEFLNLKGHLTGIGGNPGYLYGPCDLEGHVGTDGEVYVLDLARLFPPETPDPSKKGSFLYQLLRPEFVKNCPNSLSSDAFSLFGRSGDFQEHDREVGEATKDLRQRLIPQFAKTLSIEAESNLKEPLRTEDMDRLICQIHREGINVRHLGRIYLLVSHSLLKRLALVEMVARVLKNMLKEKLREIIPLTESQDHSNIDRYYSEIVVNFFNTVFGEGFGSQVLWSVEIPQGLEDAFSFAVTFSIREHMDMNLLYHRLQTLSGVRFSPFRVPSHHPQQPFQKTDFHKFVTCEKYVYTGIRGQALVLTELARTLSVVQKEPQLQAMEKLYRNYVRFIPADPEILYQFARVQLDLAAPRPPSDYPETRQLFQDACSNFEACLSLQPDFPQAASFLVEAKIQNVLSQSLWMLRDSRCTLPESIFPVHWDASFIEICRVLRKVSTGISTPRKFLDLAKSYISLSEGGILESLFDLHSHLDTNIKKLRKSLLKEAKRLFERAIGCQGKNKIPTSLCLRSLLGSGRCCLGLAEICGSNGGFVWLSRAEEYFQRAELISKHSARAEFVRLRSLKSSIVDNGTVSSSP